jgi:hypothetical protein
LPRFPQPFVRDRAPAPLYRINEQIRLSPIRLIGAAGEQHGVVPTSQALEMAREDGLDLVEVAPLEQTCAAYGTVEPAQVIMDSDTGRSKGFGFAEMKTEQGRHSGLRQLAHADIQLTYRPARL